MKYCVKLGCSALAILAVVSVTGCGKPDPRKNPDFNEASLKDPGAIKMGGDARPGATPGP